MLNLGYLQCNFTPIFLSWDKKLCSFVVTFVSCHFSGFKSSTVWFAVWINIFIFFYSLNVWFLASLTHLPFWNFSMILTKKQYDEHVMMNKSWTSIPNQCQSQYHILFFYAQTLFLLGLCAKWRFHQWMICIRNQVFQKGTYLVHFQKSCNCMLQQKEKSYK